MDSMQQQLNDIVPTSILPSLMELSKEHTWQIGFTMGMTMAMLHPEWVQAYIKQIGIGDADQRGADSLAQTISVSVVQEEPHEQ